MEATITDSVVQLMARQTFVNEAPYQREGIYLFPAPENAAANRLALVIDGKTTKGNCSAEMKKYEPTNELSGQGVILHCLNLSTAKR